MKNITKDIMNHVYGWNYRLVKAVAAEMVGEDAVKVTLEITEHVGTKEQTTHTETASFEVVVEYSDIYPAREWPRLDEIDDTGSEVYEWAKSFNEAMKRRTQR